MPVTNVKAPLTQAKVKQLTCPTHLKRIEYTCDAIHVPGLFVEVRHTGGMTYYLRYRDAPSNGSRNGSTRYQKIGRTMDISLPDAKKVALKLRAGILLGNYPGADKQNKKQCMTFNQLWDRYAEYAAPRKRSFNDDQKLFNSRVQAIFGSTPIGQIDLHSVQQFHGDLKEQGLAPSTCDHYVKLVRRCLNLAVEWDLLEKNPTAGLKLFAADDRREVFLSPAQVVDLVYRLDNHSAVVSSSATKLLLFSGLRVSEGLNLRPSDCDMDARLITLSSDRNKSKRRRTVPLNAQAIAILEKMTALNPTDSEYIFINQRTGERLKSLNKYWDSFRSRAPDFKGVRLHDLRHTYASMLINSGESLYTVQQILGHSDPKLTQRYSHLSNSVLQDAANSVSKYLDKALNKKGNTG